MPHDRIGARTVLFVALFLGPLFSSSPAFAVTRTLADRPAQLLLAATAQAPPTTNAKTDLSSSVGMLMLAANAACHGLEVQRGVFCQPLHGERHDLGGGIAYFRLPVRVGPGEHDVIALHRVVAEGKPANRAVFMIHGDGWGFVPAFLALTAYATPRELSLPVYLARNGVDVWAISFRWAQLPVGFPGGSFMAGWGLDAAISDARIGLRIARIVRRLTDQGDGRIHVLGWSRGVWTTVALANAEATESPDLRDIAGLIPVDGAFKLDPTNEAFRQFWCDNYTFYQNLLAAGTFALSEAFNQVIGQLAIDSPDGQSPFDPELTNRQYAAGRGSLPTGWRGLEWYHFTAGTFDDDGEPTGLVYTNPALFFVFLTKVFGLEPVLYLSDTSAVTCDEIDVPWDDDIAAVRNPILYVGAGGGFGDVGPYFTQLVGSDDVTTLIVREQPPELAELDIGHADIFQAPVSRQLFWEPILVWIKAH